MAISGAGGSVKTTYRKPANDSVFQSQFDTAIERLGLGLPSGEVVTWVSLCDCSLNDRALEHVAEFRELEHLQSCNESSGLSLITDKGLAQLAVCRKLEGLGLQGKGITDRGVQHLRQLHRLQFLSLGETSVSDACIPEIAKLPNLRRVFLKGTLVSRKGIVELRQVAPKVGIHWGKEYLPPTELASREIR